MRIWQVQKDFYFGSLTFPKNVKDRSKFTNMRNGQLIYESENTGIIYIDGTQFDSTGDAFKANCLMIGTFDESQVGTPSSLVTVGHYADRPEAKILGRMFVSDDDKAISVDLGSEWEEFRNASVSGETRPDEAWISPDGSDEDGDGTEFNPWKTLEKVIQTIPHDNDMELGRPHCV